MKSHFGFLAALCVTLAAFDCASAADSESMRCKGGIVSIGNSAGEVVAKCGEPATATQSSRKLVEKGTYGTKTATVTTIVVDNWIFNFGPSEFQYQLELQDGRVCRIQSLDYGY
ncbi:DUF2845 domain-containing protein [Geomonas ferrireducens]|jgi:hypothetical protein|uniref:DUF2845 domain-containing protein n=1 Tax=Geomonas ferrireducens TaxID=2570227 RepID=UPI0010A7DAB1|nr:DUF2845 domain-containing protein [Geomonas ferrireducens]